MKLSDIENPVSSLSGVGPSLAKLLARLGVFTVADLLSYWPKDWEDRTEKIPLAAFNSHNKVHTIAQVVDHQYFGFGAMRTLRIIIDDGTARGSLICFNRNFLEKTLPVNSVIAITGSFTIKYGELQSTAFEAECLGKDISIDHYIDTPVPNSAVLPIYPLTAGLTQTQLRKVMYKAINEYCRGIENELPNSVIESRNLMTKQQAIISMHRPKTMADALLAKKSLIFEELFNFQKIILKRAAERQRPKSDVLFTSFNGKKNIAQNTTIDNVDNIGNIETTFQTNKNTSNDFRNSLSPKQEELLSRLPFTLTDDQMAVIIDMNKDIDCSQFEQSIEVEKSLKERQSTSSQTKQPLNKPTSSFQMARLLQGDVGSGKTMVAFFAALRIIEYGGQCAIMAPTEILAKQHADTAAKLLEPLGIRVAFLTGNIQAAGRKPLLNALKTGLINIVIGTHALFSQSVVYKNLRFVVIDEQHRFGVVQRSAILDKGRLSIDQQKALEQGIIPSPPDFLLMSATPIPQTLALTVFGDLDVSTIKTLPKGRIPIKTLLTREGNEARVYEAVREEINKGRQAYFVYPLIENTETTNNNLKSAEEMFLFLSEQVFPEFNCAVIHSKVDETEQSRILEEFRSGKINILVATSVVEVGVDVPNASCMVIEHSERFGLAALHQLRGRVGRGTEQSFCFLVYSEKLTELGKSRLKVLHESTDGFYIAEEDLRLRGPGDVNGIQQSGYFTLGLADPIRDKEILELARQDALNLINC